MINLNSPTVQAMLRNTPQGVGNLPGYYGSNPTVTETVQPVQQNTQMPYPSPKEMLINGGQSAIYGPTSFAPNIIGGYNGNPYIQTAFQGYYNPFMGVGTFYGNPYQQSYFMAPPDQDSMDRLEAAINNGLTYEEQVNEESRFFKTLSNIVSTSLNRTEEERKKCEERFNKYNKYETEPEEKQAAPKISVSIVKGGRVIAHKDQNTNDFIRQDYSQNANYVDYMKRYSEIAENNRINNMYYMHQNAIERQFDDYDLLDFLNNAAGTVLSSYMIRECQKQNVGKISQVYDRNGFKKHLLEKNNIKTRETMSAIERFTGRYGIMPDGRPVTPGLDPSIAESFSYDTKTGQYTVTPPNFIRDRLERARAAFAQSIDT